MSTMKEAVRKGAAWLDEKHPGWETEINLQKLAMQQCHSCVIGQAIGEYRTVLHNYGYDDKWAVEHGFNADMTNYRPYAVMKQDYEKLEELWTQEVKKRFGG